MFVKGEREGFGAFATPFFRNGQPTRDGHHGSQSQAGESSEATKSEPRYGNYPAVDPGTEVLIGMLKRHPTRAAFSLTIRSSFDI